MRPRVVFTLMIALVGAAISTGSAAVQVDADSPLIQYFGRFDFTNPKKPAFDWPGCSIQMRFTGPGISVKLSGGANDFNVLIDGVFKSHLALDNAKTSYDLATGLTDAQHTLLLTKRTEGFNGIATFEGFQLADGKSAVAPPPRMAKKIQFIGDSFTVGYGDEGTSVSCPDKRPLDNNYIAYGPTIARALDADYSVQAVSGYGMVHNYGDTNPLSAVNLPLVFDRTLFNNAAPKWDFSSWIPDVVVIALGTNDFSTTVKPSQTQYTSAYQDFIKRIHGYFPQAQLICMAYAVDSYQGKYVDTMVAGLIAQGDTKVHAFTLPPLVQSDFGCDYHPNVAGQKKYAEALLPIIQKYLGTGTRLQPQGHGPKVPAKSKRHALSSAHPAPLYPDPVSEEWSDTRGRIQGQ